MHFCRFGPFSPAAKIGSPEHLLLDSSESNLYIVEQDAAVVAKLDLEHGALTTLAGNGTSGGGENFGNLGDGGPATKAQLSTPTAVVVDAGGNLLISDSGNDRVRMVEADSGIITTVAGTGSEGGYSGDGGPSNQARLHAPLGLALDAQGNLFIADSFNAVVREISNH